MFPNNLVFDHTWPISELDLVFIETNIPTKSHEDQSKTRDYFFWKSARLPHCVVIGWEQISDGHENRSFE